MFVIVLTYKRGLQPVLDYLEQHRIYLDKYYRAGNFICSGPQKPRNGGVIICTADDIDSVNRIIREDPFYINDIASYQIIEFEAGKSIPELQPYIG